MRKVKIVSVFTVLAIAAGMFGFAPANALPAQAANTVIYNLYATDAFIQLADGTLLYNYGFVGGRQGVPLTFQNSYVAAVNPGLNTTIATGAPAPTGGPITVAEAPLLGNAQFPAPLIYAAVGDVVEIRLKNLGTTNKGSPNDPHSIHLHGLDVDAANDGVPETSVGAVPANLAATPGAGNVLVYMFSPTVPGSYMYHCHQEADIHVQMGMYGALVVYSNADKADTSSAYNNGGPGTGRGDLWGWKYDKDVVLLLSEIDTRQHTSEQSGFVGGGAVFNPVNYQPQYWLINGLGFPNTIHAAGAPVKGVPAFNWTSWIAAHPGYDPFIIGSIGKASFAGTTGDKILLRTINMGFEVQPMHMHGFHAKVLGSDQRQWTWAQPGQPGANGAGTPGTGMEKNTLTIGSGETYEWLLDFGTWTSVASTYPAGTQSKYDPVTQRPVSNQSAVANCLLPIGNTNCAIPDMGVPGQTYIGGPTVGPTNKDLLSVASVLAKGGGLPPGAAIPGQLFPFHNHDDYKATNNGVYPGGMFTMIMTVP
jgi:manganese oxidase